MVGGARGDADVVGIGHGLLNFFCFFSCASLVSSGSHKPCVRCPAMSGSLLAKQVNGQQFPLGHAFMHSVYIVYIVYMLYICCVRSVYVLCILYICYVYVYCMYILPFCPIIDSHHPSSYICMFCKNKTLF